MDLGMSQLSFPTLICHCTNIPPSPRRYIRRTASVPVPAQAPPPTAPLPALPSLAHPSPAPPHSAPPQARTRAPLALRVPSQTHHTTHSHLYPTPQNHMIATAELDSKPMWSPTVVDESPVDKAWGRQGRERGYSVGNGYRIDEEMKEN